MKNADNHSSTSNDASTLQKLGFEDRLDLQRVFASILNRMRISSFTISIIMEIISYIQILSIGFLATVPGIIDGSKNTMFLSTFFQTSIYLSSLFKSEKEGNTIFLLVFLCLLIIWLIFYLIYVTKYKSSKTFSPFVINLLYYLGFHIFKIFSVNISTITGYFMRSLYDNSIELNAILLSVAIAMFFAYVTICFFMVRIVQSSPDVDIKNRFCFWPQSYISPLYRSILSYALPIILEMLRGLGKSSQVVSYVLIVLSGIGGLVLIWISDNNVFPSGKVVLSTEYIILIVAPLLSIIYMFAGGNSLYYLFAFVIIVVMMGFILSFITSRQAKAKIDLLYSKFENLTEKIKSPNDCISLIKVGIVFNAPCITNHTLLNWAVSRWPNHQQLLLMVSFIFYVIHVSYREILELVSSAVDISPFSVYDGLLFFQIFNRLPTREHHLQRKIESVKRLYDIPKASLRIFWEAVLTHQWDEVLTRSKSFRNDAEHINQIYQNLIFENPSSECVLQEFIKFATEIQGNYAAAYAAQKELITWSNCKENDSSTVDGESLASVSMSKLSSVKSSIFLSDISINTKGQDAIQSGIQNAVNGRPIYWPKRFFILILTIAVINLCIVIIVYAYSFSESKTLDHQVTLATIAHKMQLSLSQIMFSSIEFTTHNLTATETVSGVKFNYQEKMRHLNELCDTFEDVLASSFALYSAMPYDFISLWVDTEVPTIIIAPIYPSNESVPLLAVLRIFQIRAKTLAFTPPNCIGSISKPSSEILQMTYMFSSVSEVTNIIINAINEIADSEITENEFLIVIPIIVGVSLNFIFLLIFCPVTIYGFIKETDFLISLFSGIPVKVVKEILQKDSTEAQKILTDQLQIQMQIQSQMHSNDDINSKNNKKCCSNCSCCKLQKRLMPLNFYHTKSIVLFFIATFIVIPLPTIITTVFYIIRMKESQFIIDGLQLLTGFLSNFGELYLSSFRIVADFDSFLEQDQELVQLIKAANGMLTNYSELFFGGSEFFEKGISSRKDLNDKYNPDCHQLIGNRSINHACSSLHSDVYFLYGLAVRLNELSNNSAYINRRIGKSCSFCIDDEQIEDYNRSWIEQEKDKIKNFDHKNYIDSNNNKFADLLNSDLEHKSGTDSLDKFANLLNSDLEHKSGTDSLDEKASSGDLDSIEIHESEADLSRSSKEGVNSSWWRLFYSASFNIIEHEFDTLFEIFQNMSQEVFDLNVVLNSVGLGLGIVLFLFMVSISYFYMKYSLIVTMRSLLKPILVMEPEYISDSPFLMRFLQGDFDNSSRKTTHDLRKKTTTHSIPLIDFILEGVVVMTADGTIVSSNKKYHEMVGSASEEIIGLNVTSVFPITVQPLFDSLSNIAQSGTFDENDPSNKIETSIFTEDDNEIEVTISLIAKLNPGETGNKSTKCAFIINDKSELINVKNQLKKEKLKVENLLDSILPSSLAKSISNGSKEISFDANCCSILCAKIDSFSNLCNSLTSKQIMATLNGLFCELDAELLKFPRITKIKTSAESYLCAAGIFDSDGNIEDATSELANFASQIKDVISVLELKHDSEIHMKIGIFTGGPIICGVIGKDKPTFEIIGKGVNVAEQLMAKSLPDKIHISQSTANLLEKMNWKMNEFSGNAQIPGIENQKTYIID